MRRRSAWLLMAALVAACSATPQSSPTPSPVGGDLIAQIEDGPFAQSTVDATVRLLAENGVATYAEFDAPQPIVQVAGQDTGWKLIDDQVRTMALEAHYGAGIAGEDLDATIDTEADMAPPSYILGGYVAAADTPGSRAAQSLMGVEDWTVEDWREAPSVVFPQLVMSLFVADMVRERDADAAATALVERPFAAAADRGFDARPPAPPPMPITVAAGGVCSAMSNFISSALSTIFQKMRIGEPPRGALVVPVRIWNFVVSVLETVVTTIVRQFEQQVLDKIGQVVAIVGTIASIISLVRPWSVSITPEPGVREKGIAGIRAVESGRLVARYVTADGIQEDWPGWAIDCARNARRELPSLKAEGSTVKWSGLRQSPPALVQENGKGSTLDAQGASRLDFTTLMDSVEEPYKTVPGRISVSVTVEQRAIRNLADWAENEVWGMIPWQVGGALSAYLRPYLDRIKAKLSDLLSKNSSGQMPILYHVEEDATPTPPSTPPPSGPPPENRRPCQVRECAESNGDPHIVTVDTRDYDFQAVGEFVLIRSADGAFELQSRQEAWLGSQSVSYNSALAMRVGEQRLGVYADPSSPDLRATLDGQPLDLSQPVELSSDARITADWAGLQIDFADGSVVYALSTDGPHGINVMIEPSAALADSGVGLMGPVPAGGIGLPALPDGSVLPETSSRDEYNEQLYGTFADAWRVTGDSTLFDYEPGTSTESFTNRDFPPPEQILTIDDLTSEQRAAGEAACEHVPLQPYHDQCVFDVGITGDSTFAQVYDLSVNVVETGSLKPGGELVRVVNFYQNETGPTALDVYSWTDAGPALIGAVEFGQAGEWFDPGITDDGFGRLGNRISIQRKGEEILEAGLNLVELVRDAQPGVERTLLVQSGDPASINWVGGRAADVDEFYEVAPTGFPMDPAHDGGALLFANTNPIQYDQEGVQFFVGDGDHCLTQPDFPTLAQTVGYGNYGPLALEPGAHSITLLPATGQEDPFAFRCDTPSITTAVPLTVAAGDRFHLFVYTDPSTGLLNTFLLPLGR